MMEHLTRMQFLLPFLSDLRISDHADTNAMVFVTVFGHEVDPCRAYIPLRSDHFKAL